MCFVFYFTCDCCYFEHGIVTSVAPYRLSKLYKRSNHVYLYNVYRFVYEAFLFDKIYIYIYMVACMDAGIYSCWAQVFCAPGNHNARSYVNLAMSCFRRGNSY